MKMFWFYVTATIGTEYDSHLLINSENGTYAVKTKLVLDSETFNQIRLNIIVSDHEIKGPIGNNLFRPLLFERVIIENIKEGKSKKEYRKLFYSPFCAYFPYQYKKFEHVNEDYMPGIINKLDKICLM